MAWYSKSNRIIFLVIVGAVVIGATWFKHRAYVPAAEDSVVKQREAQRIDSTIVRQVKVVDSYELKWQARNATPELRLLIPAADFGAWRASGHPSVRETSDGPEVLQLQFLSLGGENELISAPGTCAEQVQPMSECGQAPGHILLHRDFKYVTPYPRLQGLGTPANFVRDVLAAPATLPERVSQHRMDRIFDYWVVTIWVKEDEASRAWSFQGWDCESGVQTAEQPSQRTGRDPEFFTRDRCFRPQGILQRWFYGWHGLQKHPAYIACVKAGGPNWCTFVVSYRGRPVAIDVPHGRWPLFEVGLGQLERWARDTAVPPSADVRVQRAGKLLAACDIAAKEISSGLSPNDKRAAEFRARNACGYAIQLAHPALAGAPIAAANAISRALTSTSLFSGTWEAYYADDALKALERGGQHETRDAIPLQLKRFSASHAEETLRQKSFEELLTLAPKVLRADDALYQRIDNGVAYYTDKHVERTRTLLAFRRAWRERAESDFGADSDIALQRRVYECRSYVWRSDDPAPLFDCGDRLMAAWEKRATGRQEREIAGMPLSEFAVHVAFMYFRSAHATKSFGEPLARVQKLQVLAETNVDWGTNWQARADLEEVARNLTEHAAGRRYEGRSFTRYQ